METAAVSPKGSIVDSLLSRPPPGYVFVVTATQDSHYDLFMLTLIRKAMARGMRVLNVVTEARNRRLMTELAARQSEQFQILEVNYGQQLLGSHSCSSHLHEINITLRELRHVLAPDLVLFEGLTPLFIDFAPRDVVQFFKECVEESVKVGSVEFYLVHNDTTDTVSMNQLFSLAQGIVTLSAARGKRYLTVRKAIGVDLPTNPIEYVPSMTSEQHSDWGIALNW